MLPPANRLVDADSFRRAVRSGTRAGTRSLVVHLVVPDAVPATGPSCDARQSEPPRVGFVVSRAVGNAVVRNRVKRRLRHLAREHVSSLPGSAVLVVRALPAAADASYDGLGTDLARGLDRCRSRSAGRVPA